MSGLGRAALTHDDLLVFTKNRLRFVYLKRPSVHITAGVQYVAKKGDVFWLIDLIDSYVGSDVMRQAIADDDRLAWMQFWRLDVDDTGRAVASCRADAGEDPAVTQVIPFTDFPLDHIEVWVAFDGEHWTLYLPSEH